MKGTLFSADFIKDSSNNLRLLELNTDTAFINSEIDNIDLTEFINVLSSNSITKVHIIYKPYIQAKATDKIKSDLLAAGYEVTLQPENQNVIYPGTVVDEPGTFFLRLCYDEAALFDSTYCKNRLSTYNLFTDDSGDGTNSFCTEYYHDDEDGAVYNTISPSFNPTGIPDATIKDIDEQFNPIDFHKIGSEVDGESDSERWDAFINENKASDKLIEKYSFGAESTIDGYITSIRQFGIIYGADLNWIDILSYKISAIFEHPSTIDGYDGTKYSNKLEDEHYYEYATNFFKSSDRGIWEGHKLEMADGTYKRLDEIAVGDSVASYFISGSPSLEDDLTDMEWGTDGNVFPEGSHLTSSEVVFTDAAELKYGAMIELKVDSDPIYAGSGKQFLAYDTGSNEMKYLMASELNPDLHFLVDKDNNLIDLDEVNFFVTTDESFKSMEIDVEDTDTVIISGSTAFNNIVAHNAPCFVGGTEITLADGTKKAIEEVKVGDLVTAYNLDKEKPQAREVRAISSKKVTNTVKYTFENGAVLEATHDHPLYCTIHGWVSYNPEFTKLEAGMEVGQITTDCVIFNLNGEGGKVTSIEAINEEKIVYNLRDVEGLHNFFVWDFLAHNRGNITCFLAGTEITLANGDVKNIEDIQIGEEVLSYKDGEFIAATVSGVDHRHTVGAHAEASKEYAGGVGVFTINGTGLKFTPEHPFLTDCCWAALVPYANQEPFLSEGVTNTLEIGDKINVNGEWEEIETIEFIETDKDTPVYNITVEGTHNYIANNVVVHNK